MAVVGAGLVGMATAWLLQRHGQRVLRIDPSLGDAPPNEGDGQLSGSRAALGVLMAGVFQRSSGRGWRLRQRSLALWEEWCRELAARGRPIARRHGLLLLAADAAERQRLERLPADRRRQGLGLELWEPERLARLEPLLPAGAVGGLYAPGDGQLDPLQALEALHSDAVAAGLSTVGQAVRALERGRGGQGWRLVLADGRRLESEWLVLCCATAAPTLLASLDPGFAADWAIEPVLGQALELELPAAAARCFAGGGAEAGAWPGAVLWRGINLVPRPDLPGGRRLWLGATVEPGRGADPAALAELRLLGGEAPPWLREARVLRSWQGLRPRPVGRPAPLLEPLAPGLLLASGHHRNGVLLAPATAEWVLQQVQGGAG